MAGTSDGVRGSSPFGMGSGQPRVSIATKAVFAKAGRARPRPSRGADESSLKKGKHEEEEGQGGLSLPSLKLKSGADHRSAAGLPLAPGMEPGGVPGQPGAAAAVPSAPPGLQASANYSYDPSGRRDPFKPYGLEKLSTEGNLDLPPLQRTGLTEINLIAIVWGGFGYSAMVQTPDGKGYTVRTGTKIGPNNGVVSAITENALVVQERFMDVYGNKQVREHVKRLHTKEGSE